MKLKSSNFIFNSHRYFFVLWSLTKAQVLYKFPFIRCFKFKALQWFLSVNVYSKRIKIDEFEKYLREYSHCLLDLEKENQRAEMLIDKYGD